MSTTYCTAAVTTRWAAEYGVTSRHKDLRFRGGVPITLVRSWAGTERNGREQERGQGAGTPHIEPRVAYARATSPIRETCSGSVMVAVFRQGH